MLHHHTNNYHIAIKIFLSIIMFLKNICESYKVILSQGIQHRHLPTKFSKRALLNAFKDCNFKNNLQHWMGKQPNNITLVKKILFSSHAKMLFAATHILLMWWVSVIIGRLSHTHINIFSRLGNELFQMLLLDYLFRGPIGKQAGSDHYFLVLSSFH